ncbi:hypothetical protein [Anaeromicrobium sediminis]|uniref:Uncharacterized protein n=1 Tax=Anaeromicrobium sediminis TaxID=1478221 RepID=A0A267MDA0_9FIRM|nr:hypothetical protein [Anaeromicrobium sediminis]PAB57529.1 hypothetical protein CCE28_18670 [Anaeromicrobium sediminis]
MKGIKKHKIIIISILALIIIFFNFLLSQEISIPSQGWSRHMFIGEIHAKGVNNNIYNDNSITIPLEDKFLNLLGEDKGIRATLVDYDGNKIEEFIIDKKSNKLKGLGYKLENNHIYLYTLEGKSLNKYDFSYEEKSLNNKDTIDEEVGDFRLVKNNLIYYKDKIVLGENFSITTEKIKRVEGTLYGNNMHIAIMIREGSGQNLLKYYRISMVDYSIKEVQVASLPSGVNSFIEKIDIGVVKDKINILVSNRGASSKKGALTLYEFNLKDGTNIKNYRLDLNEDYPSPHILKDNNEELSFIGTITVIKGTKKETNNLMLFRVKDGKIVSRKLLSKTNDLSINPTYFEIKGNEYVSWIDITGEKKKVFFASDNKNIVEKSSKPTKNEMIDIFMNILFGSILMPFYGYPVLFYILVPNLIIIGLLYIFKKAYNIDKSVNIIYLFMVTHFLVKIYYYMNTIYPNKELLRFLPKYLQGPFSALITITLVTAISIYIYFDYRKKATGESFFIPNYITFASVDILLFIFTLIPYVFAYLNLSYVVNI